MTWVLQHPYEAALATLGVTSSIGYLARLVLNALAKRAAATPELDDDQRIAKWSAELDTVMFVLDVVRRVMPRVVVGPLPSTQPIASVATSLPPMKPLSAPPFAPATEQPASKDAK